MSGLQRGWIFKLGVAVLTAAAFMVLFAVSEDGRVASAAAALMALMALEKKVRGTERVDERDAQILTRASLIGYGVFWVCFVLGCVVLSLAAPSDGSVPTALVGLLPAAGYWLLEVARSSAGLVLYTREG